MKKIKFFIELLFIFLLPLILLACSFKKVKEYDENNNEISCNFQFENIFELSNNSANYYNIRINGGYENRLFKGDEPQLDNRYFSFYTLSPNVDYPDTCSFSIEVDFDGPIVSVTLPFYQMNDLDGNLRWVLEDVDVGYIIWLENVTNLNDIFCYQLIEDEPQGSIGYLLHFDLTDYIKYYISYNDMEVDFDNIYNIYYSVNLPNTNSVACFYIFDLNSVNVSLNPINKVLNYLYNSLGISNNWILQFIVIYTLLWLIMWIIWHLIYLPLDFIVGIFIRRWDYEKN